MLASRYKHLFSRVFDPLGRWLARCGVSPTAITLATPVVTSFVCLWFLRTRMVVPFCATMGVVAIFDALDGAVARVSGRVTKFGGYLDAVCDRYVEAMIMLVVAAVTGYWVLGMIVLTGALLVSYTKARAAMEVTISNQEWPDLMERTEREVVFLVGYALSASVPWRVLGHDLFWWVLALLALLIHLTAIQRILRARSLITHRS